MTSPTAPFTHGTPSHSDAGGLPVTLPAPPRLAPDVFDGVQTVLLDFDGPVSPLMPAPMNMQAADSARRALTSAGIHPPEPYASTRDHLAVLRWTFEHSPEQISAVEDAGTRAEVAAADVAVETPGARMLLDACHRAGIPVVIVSNNAAAAIRVFLARQGLAESVQAVIGRPSLRPDLLKPHTHLVVEALNVTGADPSEAVLIGDSVSDVVVAHAVGVPAIGYAKHERRGRELAAAGADILVGSISALTLQDL